MSTLFLKVVGLNQKFNKLTLIPMPISWSQTEAKYNCESNPKKLFLYYVTQLVPNTILCVSILFLMPMFVLIPDVVPVKQKIAVVFCAGSIVPLVYLGAFLFFLYGPEMAAVANWAVATKKDYPIPPELMSEDSLTGLILSELSNFTKGARPVDWVGLIGLQIFANFTILSLLIPIVFVIADLDPYTTVLNVLTSPQVLNLPSPLDYPLIKIGLGLSETVSFMYMFNSIKTFMLVLFCSIQVIVELLKYFLRVRLTRLQLQLYRELKVSLAMVNHVLKNCVSVYLSSSYYMLLACMNAALLGWGILPWNVYGIIPATFISVGVVLLVMFQGGCGVYEISVEILIKWRGQIAEAPWPRNVKMILRSLRPHAFPVGEIGIMDRDIKGNYLDNLLTGFVNTLCVAKDDIV